jgi:hypothetical protein
MCAEKQCKKCPNNNKFIKKATAAGIPIVILACLIDGIPCEGRETYYKGPHPLENQSYYNECLHENTVLFGTTPNITTIEMPSGMYIKGSSKIDPNQILVVGRKYSNDQLEYHE